MSTEAKAPMKPLSVADLAERWQITHDAARRRISKIGLPGFNVGTHSEPDWRFRLSTVEAWEAANERSLTDEAPAESEMSVRAGAPALWDGKDRLATKPRRGRK